MSEDAFDELAKTTLAKIDSVANELREYCDSVVIITTICEGQDSQMIYQDRGSYYAKEGSVRRWLRIKMREEEQNEKEDSNGP